MHFSKLLPCIIAFTAPALSQATFGAKFYSEEHMKGHRFEIGPNEVGRRCVTLEGELYRNVKSIETAKIRGSFRPYFEVRCNLYAEDDCEESSFIEQKTTTAVLNHTNVASVYCSLEVDSSP